VPCALNYIFMFLIITCPLLIFYYREHVLLYMISKKNYKICLHKHKKGTLIQNTMQHSFIGGENRYTWRKTSHVTEKRYHIMLYRVHMSCVGFELIPLIVIVTDCTCSCASNYHTITPQRPLCLYLGSKWYEMSLNV